MEHGVQSESCKRQGDGEYGNVVGGQSDSGWGAWCVRLAWRGGSSYSFDAGGERGGGWMDGGFGFLGLRFLD